MMTQAEEEEQAEKAAISGSTAQLIRQLVGGSS